MVGVECRELEYLCKGLFNQLQPKRLGSITLRSKEKETATVLSREPYGGYVILGGCSLWGTEYLLIISWCGDLTEVLAFSSVRRLSGTVMMHRKTHEIISFGLANQFTVSKALSFWLRKRRNERKRKKNQYLLSKVELDYITFMSSAFA